MRRPEDEWRAINIALYVGVRALPGGQSLARLLAEHRGRRNRKALPPLTIQQILAWADAHHKRTGRWPTTNGGAIEEAPEETWNRVYTALLNGRRGLRGRSTLRELLTRYRGKRVVTRGS